MVESEFKFKSSQAKKEAESEFPICGQRKNLSRRNKSERSVEDSTTRTCKDQHRTPPLVDCAHSCTRTIACE